MLNAVTTRIVEIEHGRLSGFTGNYDAYQKHRALLNEQQEAAFARQQRHIAKEERFIERFRYKNTKATQVQSRIKRLDKLERVDAPMSEQGTASFNLGEVVRSGAVVLDAQGLTMGFDDVPLYSDVTFQVTRGERVGIVGPNGSGKTTLLRQIAGHLEGLDGKAVLGHKVTLGYYDQHHEAMNPKADVFGEISATRPDMKPEEVRSFMGRFLFAGEDVFKPIPSLSGGELSRVALAKLILGGANLLLLDEPTNHLDIASREALEPALAEFAGTLVVVSHDRALIDRLVDKLIVIENGRTEMHLGNYSQYRERKGGGALAEVGAETDDVLKIRREKKKKPNKRKQDDRERRARRRELESVERDIAAMEETLADLESQFSQVDPADYETAQRLKNDYDGMKTDLTELYSEWETLADELAE
jgi:ATP-binding cassette subfamily F protein 3